jgi:hypothetical protein
LDSVRIEIDALLNFRSNETECHGTPNAGKNSYIEEFSHGPIDEEPLHDFTGTQIDDKQSQFRFLTGCGERVVEFESGIKIAFSGARRPNNCVIADEAEAAEESRCPRNSFNLARSPIDATQVA